MKPPQLDTGYGGYTTMGSGHGLGDQHLSMMLGGPVDGNMN